MIFSLQTAVEVETCINSEVDFCGFIINYSKSHRYVSYEKVKSLLLKNKKNVRYVGVLVKPSLNELEKSSKLNFDYFQLYGQYENKSLIQNKKIFQKKIIASIQVKDKKDIEAYKKVEDGSDIILWDSTGFEKSLGWNHNWIKNIKIKGKKMIGGNITKDKLGELSKFADIIDVSGALETNKVKDINKIRSFMTHIKKVNNEN